jgi:hypothetical protein
LRLASELTGWKIDLYSSREWLEKGGGEQLFAPLPGEVESEEAADVPLAELAGMHPATVAVLNEAGYRTLNDIIDLERDDFLRLAGIAPRRADRIISLLDELTTEESSEGGAPVHSTIARRRSDAVQRRPGRLLRLVGLGVRGRGAVVGVEQVREGAKKNKVAFAVVAMDASRHSLDKVVPLLNARRV